MVNPVQRFTRVAVLLVAAAVACSAERGPVPLHFTVFAVRPIDDIVFRPQLDATLVPLKFYPTARSPEFSYVGEMPIAFTGGRTGDVIASATIPAGLSRALLIFAPAAPSVAQAKPTYQIHVLDDSALRLGPAGMAFINLSGLKLVGKLGARPITLGTGLSPTFRVAASTELSLEVERGERRYRSYSQTIELTASERALLILFPAYYPGSLEVQGRLLIDAPPVENQ